MPVLIHPSTPPKLAKLYRQLGSFHKLADELGVNVAHVHHLIKQGIEPTDQTEKGRETRAKLFLPRRRRKPRQRQPQSPTQKAIRRMVQETRKVIKP